MIKNIVFDMGRVLVDYDPVRVCRQRTKSEEEVEAVRKALFQSEEWILLDEDMITEEEAMDRVKRRLPNEHLRQLADWSMAHWHEYNLDPKEGMEELIQELKEKGYQIYLCSNVSLRFFEFKDRIPGIQFFDGILISAKERLIKPNPAIYQRLFEKFSICPEESFFIDDLPANIESSKKCGMNGYCFADGSVENLRICFKEKSIL